ncbi:hypothetical protein CLOLEP_01946 [[Clostridium] leptum DSM 753]|uniref:Uncharacterized protein n=1 Tax=[Clostridium] leptum DSM 753 TaxID=428125 RepID=A7VTQ3_9FIRM|nr:hypothetical protein CLOLEP_01946 [[Clostridium] leptum DSM 753]
MTLRTKRAGFTSANDFTARKSFHVPGPLSEAESRVSEG